MNLSDLKVKTKLWAGFGVMAVIVAAVAGAALHWLNQSSSRVETYLQGVAARERLVVELQSAAKSRAISARNLVLVSTPQDRALELEAVTRSHEAVQQSLDRLKRHLAAAADATAQDRTLFDKVDAIEQQYGRVALAIVGLAKDGQRDEAISKMNAECRPLLAALLTATGDFIRYEDERSTAETQAATALFAQDRMLLIATALLSAGVAGLLGWLISRAVTRPLNRAIQVAQSVADATCATRSRSRAATS